MANVFTSGDIGGNWWQEVDRLQTKLYDLEMRLKTYQSVNDEEIKRVYAEIDLVKQELALFKTETTNKLNLLEVNKADKKQEEWKTPELLNGWIPVSSPLLDLKYRKNQMGIVEFTGWVSNGTIGSTLFNLPEAYRPISAKRFVSNNDSTIRINITGEVVIESGLNTSIALDVIRFPII